MGKRTRQGGRSPSSSSSVVDRAVLRRRIVSSKLDNSFDADAVARDLKSQYPDYSRYPTKPFAVQVDKTLEVLRSIRRDNNSTVSEEDAGDGSVGRPSLRRPTRPSISEQRLARQESEHLHRIRRHKTIPSPSSSTASDDSTSTSDEAVFEANLDPEFDVMKSVLRERYSKQSKIKPEAGGEEDNIEIEAAVNKPKSTVEQGDGVGSRVETPVTRQGSSGGDEGPMFKDLGGMKGVLDELMMEVIVPLCHPQLPRWLGVRPMAGILLHGPPGCGKTKLAHAIANETRLPFYKISATEVVSGVSGASEENIRDLFEKAYRTAPSIVFIDEIDAIASKRENLQREMERRIVTQLMTCMDESHQTLRSVDSDPESETSKKKPGYVLVIGATNRPDAVDQALRRPGRFDREIVLGVPDENARVEILSVLIPNLRLEGKFDLLKIARSTPGFVGADLAALVNKAGNLAMKRIIDRRKSELCCEHKNNDTDWWRQPWVPEEMAALSITMADFEEAAKMVQPSSRREGFSSIPNIKWEDVGGLNSLRKEFDRYIIQRIKNPEDYEEFGVNLEAGFLLYGPPGCGKTLIAMAVANEAGANFIHIKGPELLNKYVGVSEESVRTLFTRARTCSPCILFFDEVDALATVRGKEGGWVSERLLNQLLIELDGSDQRKGVYVIAATNRPEVLDPALLRPGRFGKVLYVPLPSADERGLILKALARGKPIAADVDLDAIGHREACNNLSGADLKEVMNDAAMAAVDEKRLSLDNVNPNRVIKEPHFGMALEKAKPSVIEEQRSYYDGLSRNFKSRLR